MRTGPYTLCHTDRGSIQWWAWPAVSLGLGLFAAAPEMPSSVGALEFLAGGLAVGVIVSPIVGILAVAIDIMRWQ